MFDAFTQIFFLIHISPISTLNMNLAVWTFSSISVQMFSILSHFQSYQQLTQGQYIIHQSLRVWCSDSVSCLLQELLHAEIRALLSIASKRMERMKEDGENSAPMAKKIKGRTGQKYGGCIFSQGLGALEYKGKRPINPDSGLFWEGSSHAEKERAAIHSEDLW